MDETDQFDLALGRALRNYGDLNFAMKYAYGEALQGAGMDGDFTDAVVASFDDGALVDVDMTSVGGCLTRTTALHSTGSTRS